MIKWGVQKEFSEEIGNSCLISSCAISSTDFVVSSSHRTFFINKSHIKLSLPVAFSAINYLAEEDLVIGVTVGMPCIQITSFSNPTQFLLQEFMLHQSMVHQIYCSIFSQILVTIGNEIKVWNFQILKGSTTTFEISHRASFPGSPLCDGMNLVYIDEKRERVFVPHLNGFVLYSFDGKVLEKQKNFSRFLFNAVAILPSPRKFPGLDLSYQPFINIFKRLIAADPLGNVRIWHRSGQHLTTFANSSFSSSVFFIAFVNSEFVVTVNSNGDINLIDVKTSKEKIVYKIENKPDRADFITHPEPVLLVIVSRRLYSFKINVLWELFYRPVESVQFISRICSLNYSSRIALLTSDGCIFLVDSSTRFLLGSASTRGCPRPISFSYERECHETQIIAGMDNSTVHLFDYFNDDWVLKQILPFKSRIVIVGLGTEILNWIVISCGFSGDIVFYRYGTWEPLSRISLGNKQCDFAFWSRKGNFLVVLCHDRLNVICLLKLKLVYYKPLQRPNCAVFEEGKLIASYDGGILVIITLDINGITSSTKCNLCHKITYLHLKYGCHIVVFDDNSITIGKEQNMSMLTIETPFQISAVSFLSSDLDMLIALDHEIMIIQRGKYSPTLRPSLVPMNDLDNNKKEPLFVTRPKYVLQETKKKVKYDEFETFAKETPEDVLRRIKQKMMEDEENEFQFIIPKDLMSFSTRSFNRPRFHISDQKESDEKTIQKKRQPVQIICTEKSSQDEKKPIILKPSEEVLVVDESLCWGTNDDEFDSNELNPEELERLQTNQLLKELDEMIIEGDHQKEKLSESSHNDQGLEEKSKSNDGSKQNNESEDSKSILSTNLEINQDKIIKLGEKKWKSSDDLYNRCEEIHKNYNSLYKGQIFLGQFTRSKSTDKISAKNLKNIYGKTERKNDENKIKSPKSKSHVRSKFSRSRSSHLSSLSNDSSYDYLISSWRSFGTTISANSLKSEKSGKSEKNESIDNNLFSNAFESFERDQMNSLKVSLTNSPTSLNPANTENSQTNSGFHFSKSPKSKRKKKAPPRLSLASIQDDLFSSSASKSEFNELDFEGKPIGSNAANEKDQKRNNNNNWNNSSNYFANNKNPRKVHAPNRPGSFYGASTINIPQSNEELNSFPLERKNKTQSMDFIKNNDSLLALSQQNNINGYLYESDETRFNQDRIEEFDGHPNSPLTAMNKNPFDSEYQNTKNGNKDSKKINKKLRQAEKAEELFRSSMKKENDTPLQIKEPPNRPLSSRRRKKKLLDHQYPLPSDNTKLAYLDSKSSQLYHLYQPESEEEEEKEEENVEIKKTSGRIPLINKDALTLYNPLDVPKIIVRVDSSQNRQKNAVQIKVKKGTLGRKITIKRQQLISSEKKGYYPNTQYCNQ